MAVALETASSVRCCRKRTKAARSGRAPDRDRDPGPGPVPGLGLALGPGRCPRRLCPAERNGAPMLRMPTRMTRTAASTTRRTTKRRTARTSTMATTPAVPLPGTTPRSAALLGRTELARKRQWCTSCDGRASRSPQACPTRTSRSSIRASRSRRTRSPACSSCATRCASASTASSLRTKSWGLGSV